MSPRLQAVICWFILAGYLLTMSTGVEEELSEYVVSECYGDIFNFDCGRGNKIRINKDFFGYSKSRACRYSQGECIISNPKSNSLIHRFCTGHRVCTYYLVERRGCGGSFSNYQQVEYQCIPDSMVTDICSSVDYKASSTYIASPNFPENYPPKLNCRCLVSATSPGAKVRMEIVYLAIKYTHPCKDWLSIGMRRTCGTTMDLFQGRRIPIEFHSDSDDSHSGFWLHFKSSVPGDQVHVQCGNITFRPSSKPGLHHERVSGSEGGAEKPDSVQRSPRPDHVPREGPLDMPDTVTTKTKTDKPRPGSVRGGEPSPPPGIGDDPASGKSGGGGGKGSGGTSVGPKPTEEEGFQIGSEDVNPRTTSPVSTRTSVTHSGLGGRRTSTTTDSQLTNKQLTNKQLTNKHLTNKHLTNTRENPGDRQENEDIASLDTRDTESTGYNKGARDPTPDPGDVRDDDRDDGRSTLLSSNNTSSHITHTNFTHSDPISKLDDKGTWGKPPDNYLSKGGKEVSDNNSYSDDKSQVVIETWQREEEEVGGSGQPGTMGGSGQPGTMGGSGQPDSTNTLSGFSTTVSSIMKIEQTDYLTLGIIIVCICVGTGILLVCAVLLIVYFKRHGTRDEETQTPGPKPASDGDSGQGLLVTKATKSKEGANKVNKVDKSLQIDLDSDYDDAITFSAHVSAMRVGEGAGRVGEGVGRVGEGAMRVGKGVGRVGEGAMRVGEEGEDSSIYSGLYEPNCKGVQVTFNSIAKSRFHDNKKRKRVKTLIGKSSSSGIDVKGTCGTPDGSSSGSARPAFLHVSDFSDPGSYTCSEPEMGLDHKRSLASMSQYSEVTLMPENAVLPSTHEFYDSFSDPEWDQKSAISI